MPDPVPATGGGFAVSVDTAPADADLTADPPSCTLADRPTGAPRIDISVFAADRSSYGRRRHDVLDALAGPRSGACQGSPDRPTLLSGEP